MKTIMSNEEIKRLLNVLLKLVSKIEEKEAYSFTLVYTPDEESIKKKKNRERGVLNVCKNAIDFRRFQTTERR